MLPFQASDDLFFQISSNLHLQRREIRNDVDLEVCGDDKFKNSDQIITVDGQLNLRSSNGSKLDGQIKKIVHRDIERQRRQEMANLHATLVSLLPLEYVKGKRSMSDHMHQAANYIQHLQRKIKERGARRDELKKASSNSVLVRPSPGGIEVIFACEQKDGPLPLSKVLQVLVEKGINGVNCVCTRVHDRLLHIVQAEVENVSSLNIPELQWKLNLLHPLNNW